MSPRPEAFNSTMFRDSDIPLMSRIHAEQVVKNLINTRINVLDVPQQNVCIDGTNVGMSKAVLVRGDALHKLVTIDEEYQLLPRNWQDRNSKFKFWRDNFDINILLEEETKKLTISRLSIDSALSWNNHFFGFDHGYLSPGSRSAIIALSIIPDSYWVDIGACGLVVGDIRGDIYDAPWQVDGKGYLLPNKNDILVDFRAEETNTEYLISHDQEGLQAIVYDIGGEDTKVRRKKYLSSLDTIGVFADMRTMD
jgi:hypothetical protein